MALQVTPFVGIIPQKGHDPQDFDNEADALIQWWLTFVTDINALSTEVQNNRDITVAAKNSVTSSLSTSAQVLADLTAKTTEATTVNTSLAANIVIAQAVETTMAADIAAANLPASVTALDAGKSMQIKADGSGWELREYLLKTNGFTAKMGGVYIVKTSATFATPIIVPDMMPYVGEVKLRNHPGGDLKAFPVTINLPAGQAMNGENIVTWASESSASITLYKISSTEWSYEMTSRTTEKVI